MNTLKLTKQEDYAIVQLDKGTSNALNLEMFQELVQVFEALEQEWRKLYPIACTDFTRFLLGWMPTHQKVNQYHLDKMKFVLNK